ncbi:uncharacterized protein LOC142564645 [Dermacentor variabilis]|uniref:uncharacterized protein LOC142564645 n=1 Tax=Dermacentor variabilis TaxID=34621 RepID=UPI003F5B8555
MLFFTVVYVYALSGAKGTRTLPCEGNSCPFRLHDFRHVTSIAERLYVVRQNYQLEVGVGCLSMQKTEKYGTDSFKYKFRHYTGGSSQQLVVLDAELSLLTAAESNMKYAANYSFCNECTYGLRRLMHISADEDCIILVRSLDDNTTGCQLLRKSSVVDSAIPKDCRRIYKKNCGTNLFANGIYQRRCKDYTDSVIPRSI